MPEDMFPHDLSKQLKEKNIKERPICIDTFIPLEPVQVVFSFPTSETTERVIAFLHVLNICIIFDLNCDISVCKPY